MPALAGEKVGAFALTEPNAGSDVRSIATKATRTEAGWLLNGRKTFITNAPIADFIVVAAKTQPSPGLADIALFVVDLPAGGLSVNRIDKMGNLSSEVAEVMLDAVRVPEAARVGGEGAFKRVMSTLNVGRVIVSGGAIGTAQAALDAAISYARGRRAFGQAIAKFQAVSFPLARCKATIEAARLAVYRAAWLFDQGRDPVEETSIAKLLAGEAVLDVTDKTIRVFGAYGYARGYPIERYYRDARYFAIVEGTQEIHQRVIATQLGL